MSFYYALSLIFALVAIFLFAVKKFSHQVQIQTGDRLKKTTHSFTNTPLKGTILGTIITIILGSSSATTVMTVAFVNAGVITFYNSLGIIFGANIGSTITSQLFALNFTVVAPFILLLGFFLDITKTKLQKFGRLIFYFGLIFMCLSLITDVADPLKYNEQFIDFFSYLKNPFLTILIGIICSVLLQSSAVVTAITMTLATSGHIDILQAIHLMLGANIGTSSTAIIASLSLGRIARKTSMAHLLFNVFGVILIFPFVTVFSDLIEAMGGKIAQQIANAHIIFNILSATIFLIFIKQFSFIVEKITPKGRSKNVLGEN